jgi:ubiquitin thioesterase OTU1
MVFDALKARTRIENFTIKYGPPTGMQTISLEQGELEAKILGLHGETLTIVPNESTDHVSPFSSGQTHDRGIKSESGDVTIPWPEREGSLGKP